MFPSTECYWNKFLPCLSSGLWKDPFFTTHFLLMSDSKPILIIVVSHAFKCSQINGRAFRNKDLLLTSAWREDSILECQEKETWVSCWMPTGVSVTECTCRGRTGDSVPHTYEMAALAFSPAVMLTLFTEYYKNLEENSIIFWKKNQTKKTSLKLVFLTRGSV